MRWVVKIIAKILFSRLPVPYAFWKTIGIFHHGRMDSYEYPVKIFNLHVNRAYPDGLPDNSVILELGPGDSIASALLGYANKVKLTYIVDVSDFARKDTKFYKTFSEELKQRGLELPNLSTAHDINDILSKCNAKYLTDGLASLKRIPSHSIDFIWSHSVLEHVRKNEIDELLVELHRVLKPNSMSSHNIDYQDHLDFSLNNLRFSEKLWESSFFANSGFYTNRIPAVILHDKFQHSGFKIIHQGFGKWPRLPISRNALSSDFRKYTDEELINRTSSVLLKNHD
jgi:hypothetical protein